MSRFASKVGGCGSSDRLESSYSTGVAPGKRALTDGLSPSRKSSYERTGEALDDVYREVRTLKEQHIPEALVAFSGREFQRSRKATNDVRFGFSRAQGRLEDAKGWLLQVDPASRATLEEEVTWATASIASVRPDVEDVQRLAPASAASPAAGNAFSFALSLGGMGDQDYLDFDAEEARIEGEWNTTLDADEAQRWEHAEAAPLSSELCQVDGPRAEHTFSGIQLFVLAKDLPKHNSMWDHKLVGPGAVGPYRVMACTLDNKIAFYKAIHTKRNQAEWVIGPDNLEAFQANIDLYVGAARASLPGSSKVEDSQEDGAAKPPHFPSMLELEAFGDAPHQQSFNLFDAVSDANDKANGGSALVSARNMHLRLSEYTKEAERLAMQLKGQMATGEVPHDVARTQAVDGRNQLMRDTRAKLSPSGQYASRFIKSDQGVSVEDMTKRKTGDLLKASMGESDDAMQKVFGVEGTSDDLRKALDQDSELWAKYRKALEAGDDVKRVFTSAVQELGAQPAVSRAVINSAGKSNSTVTGVAKAGRVVAGAAAIYGVYDMVTTIANAEEGQRLHVAGAELGGFAGGIIGAEVGAMSAVWIASLLIPNPTTPVVIVVSLLGAAIGSAVGAEVGHEMGGPMADTYKLPGQAMQAIMGPGAAQNGGYAGLHERSRRHGAGGKNLDFLLSNSIFQMDTYLATVEAEIAKAPNREKLEAYQATRLDILDSRDQMGHVYSALQSGILSEEDVWQLVNGGGSDAP